MRFTSFDCELMFLGTLSENSLGPGWKSHSSRKDMCLLFYQMPGDTTNLDSLRSQCSACRFLGLIVSMHLAPYFSGFFSFSFAPKDFLYILISSASHLKRIFKDSCYFRHSCLENFSSF
jgi:hypothetical protein